MADFEAPSFSLGFDFDLDSQPLSTPVPLPSPKRAKKLSPTKILRTIDEEDDDFESLILRSDLNCTEPPPTLKRLRRGSVSGQSVSTAAKQVLEEEEERRCDLEDEIEEFSSQEDEIEDHPKTLRSVCSSSKIPLHRHGEFSSQSASQYTGKKQKEDAGSSVFENMEKGDKTFVFHKLSASPLRRFRLMDSDSDSDDPSMTDKGKKDKDVESPGQCAASHSKDFLNEKSFGRPTPAFDEFFKEYSSSTRNRNDNHNANNGSHPKNSFTENNIQQKHTGPQFHAHNYFFHKDLRIQKLVRDRLPHFSLLGANSSQGSKQSDGSVNYIGQFAARGGPENQTGKVAAEASSSKRRKKNNPKEATQEPAGWVNPKSSAEVPKNAGKRRVQAVEKSAGRWFTDADGKRIYVNRNGEELTGQIAYRHYRKENKAGFKKSKNKAGEQSRVQ